MAGMYGQNDVKQCYSGVTSTRSAANQALHSYNSLYMNKIGHDQYSLLNVLRAVIEKSKFMSTKSTLFSGPGPV